MIHRVLMLGLTVFSLSACVNDGELFEEDANVEGDGLFSDSLTADQDDVPVLIMEGETTGVMGSDNGQNTPDAGTGGTMDSDGINDNEADSAGSAGAAPEGSDNNNSEMGGSSTGATEGGANTPVVPELTDAQIDANNGLFLLPADCQTVVGNDGRKYCYSQLSGENIFVTTANDRLLWSYNIAADSGFSFDRMLAGETLLVISRATNDSGMWNFVSLSRVGEPLYNADVLAGSIELIDVQLRESGIFTVTNRGEGNGYQVSRLDLDTGAEAADLRFPDAIVESLEFDETDDGVRMILTADGRRQYYDPLTFERLIIVFALDSSNYQESFPQMMSSLRGDYIADFIQVLRDTSAFFDAGAAPLELDGSLYSCGVSGTVELLPENNRVNSMTFTQAYQYSDCVFSSDRLNGKVVYSALGVESTLGSNGTEILTFDAVEISSGQDTAGVTDENSASMGSAARSLDASMSNVWLERAEEFSSDKVITVASYSDTRGDIATRVSNASYSRVLSGGNGTEQASSLVVSESGASEIVAAFTGNVATTVSLDPSFTYGGRDSGSTNDDVLASAPNSGVLLAQAADGSSLRVDASNAIQGGLIYTIDTESAENSFEDIWTVTPLSSQLRF